MSINVIVVDDEPLAREGVLMRLGQESDINVIAECGNGSDAIRAILDKKPDLVFLDIKMPQVSGFDVIKAIGTEHMPLVVFMTAYDEFAVKAFQVNALDYLLKPLNSELFQECLSRIRAEVKKNKIAQRSSQLSALLNDEHISKDKDNTQFQDTSNHSERFVVRSHGHVHFLRTEDILWVEADGDYINVHTQVRSHLVRETMRNMEQRLLVHGFQRIHRSVIVRLDLIRELITTDSGDYEVVIEGGTKLKLSRSYKETLFQKLQ